jgi:hypothetical protein
MIFHHLNMIHPPMSSPVRKRLTIFLNFLGIAASSVVLLWCVLAAYVYSHKQQVLNSITTQLNENISGKLTIRKMDLSMIKGFPGISAALQDISLEDSLYYQHHRKLLEAKSIYVSVNLFSMLQGHPRIHRLFIADGKINVFTDSTGYSNIQLFKHSDTADKEGNAKIGAIDFSNVTVVFENEAKNKLFQLVMHTAKAQIDYNTEGWKGRANVRSTIKDFAFNTTKGSFLKDKDLYASLSVIYDKAEQRLTIPEQTLRIDNDKIKAFGIFDLSAKPVRFQLRFQADRILLKDATTLLSPNISAKVNHVHLSKPIAATAFLSGNMQYRDTPLVQIQWKVKNNELSVPQGAITNCSFTGSFTNERTKGKGHNDPNSMISVYGFRGNWEDIPVRVDTLHISNLISPVLEGRFRSDFAIRRLNPIIGGHSFQFDEGKASLDLIYKGGISQMDTNRAYVYGSVKATNVSMTYLPRNLHFSNAAATITFRGRDILVSNVSLRQGHTELQMQGSLLNFLSLYYTDPGKMLVDWTVHSRQIDLGDFTSFLGQRKYALQPEVGVQHTNATLAKTASQMDKLLAECTVHLHVNVDELLYETFRANDISADVLLGTNKIRLDQLRLNHAGGQLTLNSTIDQQRPVNDFKVKATVTGVDVQRFFSAFQNFGQDAITDANVRGRLFADVDVRGSMSDKGKIVPYSLNGTIGFNLQDGALVRFDPIQKIGNILFRNRDIKHIDIRKLENTMYVSGDRVRIPKMFIESSALNLQVEGVYAFRKGTDINIDVPLRNPKKGEDIVNDSLRQKQGMKGIVVHLKAVDGDDGNVKIKLR